MNETERLLELLSSTFPDISTMDPFEARAAVDGRIRPAANLNDAVSVDHLLDTAYGRLPVRVYQAAELRSGAPVTLYAHGGGYLHGNIAGHDSFCRSWAKHTGMTVVSVEHRLAPEHGAPAACEDLVSAAEWVVSAGIADAGVLLAGDSSGANAAAVTALTLRGRTDIRVVGQVLLYPFLDPEMNSASYHRLGDNNFVTATTLATYWRHYLAAPGTAEAEPWQVNPALAEDLSDVAPAIIVTAGLDPLCDEDRAYAHRLRAAGVPVLLRHYPDQFHGFATIFGYGPAVSAQEMLWSDIARHFTATEEAHS